MSATYPEPWDLPAALVAVDGDGRVVAATAVAAEVLGTKVGDLLGRRVDELVLPTTHRLRWGPDLDPTKVDAAVPVTGAARVAAIEVDAEALAASFATELAERDRRQAKLLGHIDDTISIVDENGEIRGGTGDVKGLLGYPPGYLSEHSIFDLVAPDEVDRAWETMHRILSSPGEEIRGEFHIQAADGSWAEVEVIAVNLLHDPDVRGGIVTTRNVTVRNNQARELARARDDALRQARFRGEFVASVSHELRTPLHALLGLTELLLADPDLGDTAHAMAAAAHGQGENLRRLVDDLLDLSRIESGRLVLERVPFDPVQVVREVCAALAPRAAEHDLELHVHVPDPDAQATDEPELAPLVLGDPGRFRQVITNLVGNAVKFTDAGSIDVTVGPGPMLAGSVQVRVADTGIGMSDETLDGLFQPFHQGPNAIGRRYGGTGLGLAISRELALLMGGTLRVESTLGEGSAFTFICSAPATDLPVRARVDTVLGGRGRVLVVEDSPANRLLAVHQLERLGYEPLVAPSGTDALELLAHDAVDAVLMDWQMPDLDGLETTRRLRVQEHGSGHRVPVIGVTASARAGDEEQCRAAGMDDFLPKPVLLADLDAMLHRWIVPAPGDAPADATGPALGAASASAGEPAAASPIGAGAASVSTPSQGEPRAGVEGDAPAEPEPLVDEAVLRETGEDLGDPDIVDRLITVFLEELPERRAQLLAAVEAGHDDDARRAAHTVRGAALMLGATRLATRCADLEHAGEAGATDEPPGADELARLCDDTAAAFVAHLQRANESAGTP